MTRHVIVAGGGLAGAAAAAALARAGVKVMVIEREPVPVNKICGEFLSGEARAYLARIGFDVAALGGQVISRLRLVRGAKAVASPLPFQAIGLSRLILDEALLRHAEASGADVRRGYSIKDVDCSDGIRLDVTGMGAVPAQALFLATGKHDARGLRRRTAEPETLVGFKMYFRLMGAMRAELARHIEVILFADGYAGLQLVDEGRANLCLLVDRSRLQRTGGSWGGLLQDLLAESPHLAARLEGAVPLLEKPLTIYRMPYGFVHAPRANDAPGVFRLGDQAGVIPSFTGDGMAIALHSAAAAADAYLKGCSSAVYHQRLGSDIGGQIRRASALYRLGRSPAGQCALFGLASLWPHGLQLAAKLTRVSKSASVKFPASP